MIHFINNIRGNKVALAFTLVFLLGACTPKLEQESKPNILWIFLEDTSPLISVYGDSTISTPNIDALAKKGIVFTNAIMPAPVCSASRSSIITGLMSTTLGMHNHHSSRTEESAVYLPDSMKTIPELFREAGYFTFNNGKDDYNFQYERRDLYSQDYKYHPLYGKSGEHIDLKELKGKGSFFGQIQLKGGKEIFSSTFKDRVKAPVERSEIQRPPYLPNHPAIIEEYANHLDAIQITDEKLGDIIQTLKENGLLENTIVFFFSDHGIRMTRHKQFLYEGGIRVPLIIADFTGSKKINSNATNDKLISELDLGPVSLGLAGLPIPAYMEGINVLDESQESREFVISSRDRCDFTIDRIRSVRSEGYKYIRNYLTDRPYTQPTYMDFNKVEFVTVMHQLYADGQLDSVQSKFFLDERPAEELYDLKNNPFELNNLSDNPKFESIRLNHASILSKWEKETNDQGQYPENEEGLKLMLGIWGKTAINPEYDQLRSKYEGLEGSLLDYKNQGFKLVTD